MVEWPIFYLPQALFWFSLNIPIYRINGGKKSYKMFWCERTQQFWKTWFMMINGWSCITSTWMIASKVFHEIHLVKMLQKTRKRTQIFRLDKVWAQLDLKHSFRIVLSDWELPFKNKSSWLLIFLFWKLPLLFSDKVLFSGIEDNDVTTDLDSLIGNFDFGNLAIFQQL